MSTHNIIGSEATDADRLAAFSHVHGSMVWGPSRRRRTPAAVALAFLAGASFALALTAFLITRA